MSCFSMIEKFVMSKCYPAEENSSQTSSPRPVVKQEAPPVQVPINTGMFMPMTDKVNRDEEDFFKDIEPVYKAPKTVSGKAEVVTSSGIFEMEEDTPGEWNTEDITID